jgi:hypothetical protein
MRYRYNAWPDRKWWKVAHKHWETVEVPRHIKQLIQTDGTSKVRKTWGQKSALEYTFKCKGIYKKGAISKWARERGTSARDIRTTLELEIARTLCYLAFLDERSSNYFGREYLWVVSREVSWAPSDIDMFFWAVPREQEDFYKRAKRPPATWDPKSIGYRNAAPPKRDSRPTSKNLSSLLRRQAALRLLKNDFIISGVH